MEYNERNRLMEYRSRLRDVCGEHRYELDLSYADVREMMRSALFDVRDIEVGEGGLLTVGFILTYDDLDEGVSIKEYEERILDAIGVKRRKGRFTMLERRRSKKFRTRERRVY